MRNKSANVWIITGTFLALVLAVLCQPLLAEYIDPQQRFSLEPPGDWQVRASEDGSGMATFTAPDGITSLIVMPMTVPESTTLDALPSTYERILKEAQPGTSVEMVQETHVEIAGQPALQREYIIERAAGERAKAVVTFVKVGQLSLTLAATASEMRFAQIEPALQFSIRTLRFPATSMEEEQVIGLNLEDLLALREEGLQLAIGDHAQEIFSAAEDAFHRAVSQSERGNSEEAENLVREAEVTYREAIVTGLREGPLRQAESELEAGRTGIPLERYRELAQSLAKAKELLRQAEDELEEGITRIPLKSHEELVQDLAEANKLLAQAEDREIATSRFLDLIDKVKMGLIDVVPLPIPIGPRIYSFTPSQGYPGTVLEINGVNFSAKRADNHVKVGGVNAIVVEASATRLKVITGIGTDTGPVEVEVGTHKAKGPQDFKVLSYPSPGSSDDGPPMLYQGAGSGAAGDLPGKGAIRLLVVPCYPQDRTPANMTNTRTAITNTFNQARTFYRQASYNTLTVNVTVANWHQLSGNYTDYVFLTGKGSPNIYGSVLPRLTAEAAKAAEDGGHDLDNFDIMAVVLFGNGQFLRAWGGWSESSFSYKSKKPKLDINISVGHAVNLLAMSETADWGRCAHEIGHNIVKAGKVLDEDVYDSDLVDPSVASAEPFDMMGDHDDHPLFSGFYMQQLKYYSNANIVENDWDRNPFKHEYEIVAHGATQNSNPNRYHLVRIKVTDGLYYYIEVRQRPDPTASPVLVFDGNIPLSGASNGGVVVTKVLTDKVNMNQEMRLITLLHDQRVLNKSDVATDPLRALKITVVNDNVVARPLTCRVRVEWAQTIADDPKGKFDLTVKPWDSNYQTDDIWIDRQPWGTFDYKDSAGKPKGNGDKPRPKEINHFWGRVSNSGQQATTNVRLTFYSVEPPGVGDNGNWAPLQTKVISNIAKSGKGEVFVNWVPLKDRHTCLKVVAEQQLGEVTGGNNSAQENVFDFEAPASSVPKPVIIPVAVRNPLKERIIALLSVRGLPDGFIAQIPHSWVWLDPLQERRLELTVVSLYDYSYYQDMKIKTANILVDGGIPHSYENKVPPGVFPASVMSPMGGLLARVTPKRQGTVTLWEDQEYQQPEAVALRGVITPALGGQPLRVDLTDPHNRLRVQQVTTDAAGHFYAVFDLTRAPSEDPWGKEPGQKEQLVPGDYRAQAFIINAPDVAEAASNVVYLKK